MANFWSFGVSPLYKYKNQRPPPPPPPPPQKHHIIVSNQMVQYNGSRYKTFLLWKTIGVYSVNEV